MGLSCGLFKEPNSCYLRFLKVEEEKRCPQGPHSPWNCQLQSSEVSGLEECVDNRPNPPNSSLPFTSDSRIITLSPEGPGRQPLPTSHLPVMLLPVPGYGFVDFDSPSAAQKAVTALRASGVQAQMAKVRCGLKSASPERLWRAPRFRLRGFQSAQEP